MSPLSKRVDQVRVFSRSVLATPQYVLLSQMLSRSRVVASTVKRSIVNNAASGHEILTQAGARTVNHTVILLNALLASDISHSVETWLKVVAESSSTAYDRAMDATYNATHIGGGQLHRLFDGGHTLWGSAEAARNALPDDSVLQETTGYFTALWHDLSTPVGLPLIRWNEATYDQVASFLKDSFHVPKPWFQDLLHVNAVELFGTSLGALAVALHWKRRDVKRFSRLCGSLGVSALVSANPALGILVLAALAKSFMDARQEGNDYSQVVKGLAKGGVGTGIFLGTATVVGGPVVVGLLTGMCVGIAANKVIDTVTLSDISEFLTSSVKQHLPMYAMTSAPEFDAQGGSTREESTIG